MYCFSFFSIQITDHSICNFTSLKSKRVYISNEMLLMNSLSIYKTGPAKNCASKLRCKEKKGGNGQTTKASKMEKYNWFMYIHCNYQNIRNPQLPHPFGEDKLNPRMQ